MFNGFVKLKDSEKKLEVLAAQKKEGLPIKLEACERLLLLCDRINPVKMLLHVPPISEDTSDYLQLLIANIEQEFAHNLVQQIYISEATWTAIYAAKNAVINKLRKMLLQQTICVKKYLSSIQNPRHRQKLLSTLLKMKCVNSCNKKRYLLNFNK